MSFLTEKLPEGAVIGGKLYRMNTDFRVWLKAEEVLRGDGDKKNIVQLLKLCYIDLPPALSQAAEGIAEFYTMGQQSAEKKGMAKTAVMDFEYDAKYIMAAFWSEYQIDLHTAKMHWHDFLTLLQNISEDSMLCKIMQYRSVNLSKIKDKEQRAFYRKMQKRYKLPDRRSETEKESAMAEAMWS